MFIGRTYAEAETPILWAPDVENWLIGRDPDAGKDWRQEKKGTTEDELFGWYQRLGGYEFEQAPGVGNGQGGLVCCSPWGCRVGHNWATELNCPLRVLALPTWSCNHTLVTHFGCFKFHNLTAFFFILRHPPVTAVDSEGGRSSNKESAKWLVIINVTDIYCSIKWGLNYTTIILLMNYSRTHNPISKMFSSLIINLILVLTIWWCLCVESSLVLLEEGVCYDQCVLLAKLCQPLLCFILYSKSKLACLLVQLSLDFLLLHSSPLWWKGYLFFFIVVLEVLVGHRRTIQLHLLQHYWLGHRFDYCDIEWFALEMNRGHSVIFEIAPKYCSLDSFVHCESYSISSMGFLPTVVDIIVIWVKFAHFGSF